MLFVLLAWCYICVTAFVTGYASLLPFRRLGYTCRRVTAVLMAGLCVLTVYAQVFSLFAGVGLAANLLLLFFDAVCILLWRRDMWELVRSRWKESGRGFPVFLAALVLFMAYGASRGYMHVDTGLYHAQAIRWIEEYGVVPGLGNLHSRFAYNSAAFPLCALYSLKWIFGQSLHAVQGFLALLVAVQCVPLAGIGKRKRLLVSDFVRVGALYYLTVLYGEMVSPASDYFAMLFLFFVLIAWLDLCESGEKNVTPYALLSLFLVYTVTVKLSAAVIALLVIKPAVMLLRERRWKEIGLYLGLGLGIAAPWLIRGVLISGWLFYPFTFLDLFPVDWKLEKGYADCDSREIQVFARLLYDVNLYDTPFSGWVGGWFAALKGLEKLWVASSAGSLALAAGSLIPALRAAGGERLLKRQPEGENPAKVNPAKESPAEAAPVSEERRDAFRERCGLARTDWLLYAAVLAAGFLFWQFSAPLVRYGYVYILVFPTAMAGFWVCFLTGRKNGLRRKAAVAFTVLLFFSGLYKAVDLAGAISLTASQDCYIAQQDYGEFEAVTYQVDGLTIYVPADGGQIGYDLFPSSPRVQDIELRGEGSPEEAVRSGFRAVQKDDK